MFNLQWTFSLDDFLTKQVSILIFSFIDALSYLATQRKLNN